MADYKTMMDKLLELPACALITTGRTGSDLLQSLLDSHPEVLLFNGSIHYHDFWKKSRCVLSGSFDLNDFLDEFIGTFIQKFKSRYDIEERKDQLGDNYNQTIDIDLKRFKSEVIRLLDDREINSKNSLLAIYAAYALCLGQRLEEKKLFFHHEHNFELLGNYLTDFPSSKIICMTRDPRANFVSGIENWRKYRPNTDRGRFLYYYIKRILADANVLENLGKEYIVIRIEDLGNERILQKLCQWLNISYNDCLKRSTWAGLSWHADRLSTNPNKEAGWSKELLKNRWETRLRVIDKFVLNYIMFYRLRYYGYGCRKISIISTLIVPFLIMLPLSYELRFFSLSYLRSCFKNNEYRKIIANAFYYQLRVGLFLRYYWNITVKRKFFQPLLTCEQKER